MRIASLLSFIVSLALLGPGVARADQMVTCADSGQQASLYFILEPDLKAISMGISSPQSTGARRVLLSNDTQESDADQGLLVFDGSADGFNGCRDLALSFPDSVPGEKYQSFSATLMCDSRPIPMSCDAVPRQR